jgi:hypothetical protein
MICTKCKEEKGLEFYKAKKSLTGYTHNCKDCMLSYSRIWRSKKENKAKMAKYSKENYNPEKKSKWNKSWKQANIGKINANCAKRRASKLNATVGWADLDYIRDLYVNAREASKIFGVKFHIDHIIPLINDKVCGLHCEGNLQVLPAGMNLAKGNYFRSSV